MPEAQIYLLCLVAAPQGVHAVCSRFPALRVLVSAIDAGLGPDNLVVPGVGEFGARGGFPLLYVCVTAFAKARATGARAAWCRQTLCTMCQCLA